MIRETSSATSMAEPVSHSGTSGVAMAAQNPTSPVTTSAFRAPSHSPNIPPGSWNTV